MGGICRVEGHPPDLAYSRENDGVLDAEELGDGSLEGSGHCDGAMGMPDGGMDEVEMRRCLYGGCAMSWSAKCWQPARDVTGASRGFGRGFGRPPPPGFDCRFCIPARLAP